MMDSLSKDFHLSNEQIIAMLTSLHSNLSSSQITIIDLPQKHISSWISDLIAGAEMARSKGVTKATHSKRNRSWDH